MSKQAMTDNEYVIHMGFKEALAAGRNEFLAHIPKALKTYENDCRKAITYAADKAYLRAIKIADGRVDSDDLRVELYSVLGQLAVAIGLAQK